MSDIYSPEANIYSIPDGLLYDPTKKERIEFTKTVKGENLFSYAMNLAGQGSNCWAVHGNHTQSGKPIISCDPHLAKLQFSIWYINRLSWKQVDPDTGEIERTYLLGASCVGTTSFSHGRTPVLAWGMTAVNPDVSDIFVETIRNGTHYLAGDDSWEPIMKSHETIKIKGKPDLTHTTFYTRNGVLLPPDLLEGSAKDMMPWISSDFLFSDEVDGVKKVYSLANVYDPISVGRFEPIYDYAAADWPAMQ